MMDRDIASVTYLIYASRVMKQDVFHQYDAGNRADTIVYTHSSNHIIAVIKHIRADAVTRSPTSQLIIEKQERAKDSTMR